MSDSTPNDATRLMRLVDGFVTTQLIYVAAKLGIAPLLAEGAKTTDELADTLGVDAALLHRVLRGSRSKTSSTRGTTVASSSPPSAMS